MTSGFPLFRKNTDRSRRPPPSGKDLQTPLNDPFSDHYNPYLHKRGYIPLHAGKGSGCFPGDIGLNIVAGGKDISSPSPFLPRDLQHFLISSTEPKGNVFCASGRPRRQDGVRIFLQIKRIHACGGRLNRVQYIHPDFDQSSMIWPPIRRYAEGVGGDISLHEAEKSRVAGLYELNVLFMAHLQTRLCSRSSAQMTMSTSCPPL